MTYLKTLDYWVRGVDLKYPDFTTTDADEFEILDLRRWDSCLQATRNVNGVYALAADMGGWALSPVIILRSCTTTR